MSDEWGDWLDDDPWQYGGIDFRGEAPEPRWGPERPLAERITRIGPWGTVDPLREGRVWNLTEWITFALWALLLGGSFGVAWRRTHG